MREILFFAFIVVGVELSAQSLDLVFLHGQYNIDDLAVYNYRHQYEEIDGHPFTSDGWLSGSVTTKTGQTFSDLLLKYEVVNGLVMIMHNGDSLYTRSDYITEFIYFENNKPIEYKNGLDAPTIGLDKSRYVQVIHEGEWSLYKEIKKELREADFNPVTEMGSRYNYFKETVRYLSHSPDGYWSAINPSRRGLTRLFGEKGREVIRFVRDNKLGYNNDDDLARIFDYVSGLE